MTKPEALEKLLRLGALSEGEIRLYTNWSPEEVRSAIHECGADQLIFQHVPGGGNPKYESFNRPFKGEEK